MTKALITWGGWQGHTPKETSEAMAEGLRKENVEVTLEDSLDSWADQDYLKTFDVIVPCWTMGELTKEQQQGIMAVVKDGVGLAGIHGGMGDAFRGVLDYEWMVGGLFVGHPYVDEYTVCLTEEKSPITDGMAHSFPYKSEQYYMLLDPGIRVLADTMYEHNGERVRMPVVWTKTWGKGKVFYSALGHEAEEFVTYPEVLAMTVRGLIWAAR